MEEASTSSNFNDLSESCKEEYVLLDDGSQYHTDEESQYHELLDSSKDDVMYYQQQNAESSGGEQKNDDQPKIILDQERFLPIANVARIMKRMIPDSGKLAKEAKECVQECVSEFISFLTSEASDKCLNEKRRTITADDLIDALSSTGLFNYVEPVKALLNRHKAINKLLNNTSNRFNYNEYNEQPSTSRASQPMTSDASPMVTVIPTASHHYTSSGAAYALVVPPGSNPQMLASSMFASANGKNVFHTVQTGSSVGQQSPQILRQQVSVPAGPTRVVQTQQRTSNLVSQNGGYQEAILITDSGSSQPQQIQMVAPQKPIYATGEDGNPVTLVPGGEVLNNGETSASTHGALLHPQNMQIYVDPVTKQHYVAVEAPDGPPHLFPITIKDEPVTMNINSENGISVANPTASFSVVQSDPKPTVDSSSENSNDGPPVLEAIVDSRPIRHDAHSSRRSEHGHHSNRSVPYTVPNKK